MRRKNIFLLVLGLILINILFLNSIQATNISLNLEEKFLENNKLDVIIEQTPPTILDKINIFSKRMDVEKITKRGDTYTAKITKEEFEKLKKDPSIKSISPNTRTKIFMGDVVGIVKSNSTNNLQIQNINLTGNQQSVCVLDTGINSSHPDFSGRIVAQHCFCSVSDSGSGGCCEDNTTEDTSAPDGHGHGTHVAGIVGANGRIKGIAPGIGLVIVKIMNDTGDGNSFDLESAIDWCISNKDTYNISVITASIGDPSTKYSNYCDAVSNSLTSKINSAVSNNLSVTIATGNNNWSDGISWPSCITNVTRVGSATKLDTLSPYSRNSLVKLLGIGSFINSTLYSGGYGIKSGTSMATPMVAGAIAIIKQYFKIQDENRNSTQIENYLYDSGKTISEGENNYSRINLYDTLLNIDSTSPTVNLVSPQNNSLNSNNQQIFVCNGSDWQLSSTTLKIWNETSLFYNLTKNSTGEHNQTSFNVTNLTYGEYFWNCFIKDEKNNLGTFSSNYTLNVQELKVDLISPKNNSGSNLNQTTFICNSSSEISHSLTNISFSIWNFTNLIYMESKNISGITNQSIFNYTFINQTNYSWNCLVYNNNSDSYLSENYTYFFDTLRPNVTLYSPENSKTYTSNSQEIVFIYNVNEEQKIENCSLVINEIISKTNTSITNFSRNQSFTQSFSPGIYNWTIDCVDKGNNRNLKLENRSFVINSVPTSSGGGGGGASSTREIIEEKQKQFYSKEDLEKGFSHKMKKSEKIFIDIGGENHTISLENITSIYVGLLIQSNPQFIYLIKGVEQKVSLKEGEYNLLLNLISSENGVANISIIQIHELLEKRDNFPIKVFENKSLNTSEDEDKSQNINSSNDFYSITKLIYYLILFFILIFIYFLIKKIFRKKDKLSKKKVNSSKKKRMAKNKKSSHQKAL